MLSIALSLFAIYGLTNGEMYRPVVLMHGITATAADMNELAGWIRQSYKGIYVVSIEIGNGYDDSFLLPMNKQVELFCSSVLADVNLRKGFNVLGVSQGSLIVRGAIQRCSLPAYNFISLVGPHQGCFGVPGLQILPVPFRELVSKYAYEDIVQNVISISNYWRDPYQLDTYFTKSHFLPNINNEGESTNETYRSNILKLNSLVLVYTDLDEVISPPQSGWFLGYQPYSLQAETWNQSRQYTENLLGMRTLFEEGKLTFFTAHTRHQDINHTPNQEFFFKNLLPFYNNTN